MDIDVKHIAELAKLSLSEEELTALGEDLKSILGHVENLFKVDVEGVPPTFGCVFDPGDLESYSDKDVARPGLLRAIALLAAPSVQDVYFKVPRGAREE